jgi:hypothetical protein
LGTGGKLDVYFVGGSCHMAHNAARKGGDSFSINIYVLKTQMFYLQKSLFTR